MNCLERFGGTNLNLYRTLVTTYEMRNVRAAAEMLGTSHSNVSQNLKQLSRQIGVRLFIPASHGVEPTSETVTLYPIIKDALESIRSVEQGLLSVTKDTHATIRISVSSQAILSFLEDFFTSFKQKFLNITFTTVEKTNSDAYTTLKNQQADIHIGAALSKEDIEHIELFKIKCGLITLDNASTDQSKNTELSIHPIYCSYNKTTSNATRVFLDLLKAYKF